jgi:hypothetical protein
MQEAKLEKSRRDSDTEGRCRRGLALLQDGVFKVMDALFARTFGYPAIDELIGRSLLDLIEPMNRPNFAGDDTSILKWPLESVGLKKNGQVFYVGISRSHCSFAGRPARLIVARALYEGLQA